MSRQTLGIVIFILGALAAPPAVAEHEELLEAYERVEEMADLDEGQRYRSQLDLLEASVKATETSLELVDATVQTIEQAAVTGMLVAPDGLVTKKLEKLSKTTQEATEALNKRWPMKGIRAVHSAREYWGEVEKADAEIRTFIDDQNLPPDAAQALLALRGFGEALQWLDDVPLVGDALSQYGETAAVFANSFRRNYRKLAPGGEEGALLNSYSNELLQGFPGMTPTETQVLRATRWAVPLVRDADGRGREGTYYLKTGKSWVKVDGDQIAAIVSDLVLVYGQPRGSMVSRGFTALKKNFGWLGGEQATIDWSEPPAGALLLMAQDPDAEFDGLSRRKLRAQAEEHLALLLDQREMPEVLRGLPGVDAGDITGRRYHEAKKDLRKWALWLGVPLSHESERKLMRQLFVNEERVWQALRTQAFRLHPGGEDYVRGLGEDPWALEIPEAGVRLRELRQGDAFVPVQVKVLEAASRNPVPGARVTLERALGSGTGADRQSGPLAVSRADTNARGVATLEVLRGRHFLSAEAAGFGAHLPAQPTAFMERLIERNDEPHRAIVTLASPALFEETLGSLAALVVDRQTEDPIPGARVTLRRGGERQEAAADGEGVARIDDVPFGAWTLVVEADGYESASRGGLELGPGNPELRGTLRLKRLEPEIRPVSLPVPTPEPPKPEAEKSCGFQALDGWTGQTSTVVDRAADGSSQVAGHPGREVEVAGPGRLKVSVVASGHHEQAGDHYGFQRLKSYVIVTADPSVTEGGRIVGGGYYLGNRDSMRRTFLVRSPGAVSLRFVPESCRLRKGEGGKCWITGTPGPGRKLLPMKYELKVEFDPCGK